jgi:hypothetical protein
MRVRQVAFRSLLARISTAECGPAASSMLG